jgi:hypothetical protein
MMSWEYCWTDRVAGWNWPNTGSTQDRLQPFHKLNYPVVIGNDDLGEQFGVVAMPLTLLIDRKARLPSRMLGWWKGDFDSKDSQPP